MTCPGTYPTVLNGQVYYNDSSTVEFECLSGFYMTGSKRITCTAGTWQTAPTCSVIRQYDDVDVYPDWWFIALAVILGLVVLACFLCLLCYFCCCRGDNVVHPYGRHRTTVCCGSAACNCCCRETGATTVVRDEEVSHDGVYFIPANHTPTAQGKYFVVSKPPTHHQAVDTDELRRTANRDAATDTGTDRSPAQLTVPKISYVPEPAAVTYGAPRQSNSKSSHVRTSSRSTAVTNGPSRLSDGKNGQTHGEPTAGGSDTPRLSDSHTMTEGRGGRVSKAWKDSANLETRSDGDLNERPQKARKHAKEVRTWLPHSNPVRNINTSTK